MGHLDAVLDVGSTFFHPTQAFAITITIIITTFQIYSFS
jgi:hypothetical protein